MPPELTPEQQQELQEIILLISNASSLDENEIVEMITDFIIALNEGKGFEFITVDLVRLREQELSNLQQQKEQLSSALKQEESAMNTELVKLEKLPDMLKEKAKKYLDEAFKKAADSKKDIDADQIASLKKTLGL